MPSSKKKIIFHLIMSLIQVYFLSPLANSFGCLKHKLPFSSICILVTISFFAMYSTWFLCLNHSFCSVPPHILNWNVIHHMDRGKDVNGFGHQGQNYTHSRSLIWKQLSKIQRLSFTVFSKHTTRSTLHTHHSCFLSHQTQTYELWRTWRLSQWILIVSWTIKISYLK